MHPLSPHRHRIALAAAYRSGAVARAHVAIPPPADGTISSLVREFLAQAHPVVTKELLPVVTRDPVLQKNIGTAAGQAIGEHIAGPVKVAAVAVTALAAVAAYKLLA